MAEAPGDDGGGETEGRGAVEVDPEGEVVAGLMEHVGPKIEAGEPLSDADIQALEDERDIISLGMLAETVRRNLHGTSATFVRVFDLKLSGIRSAAVPGSAGEVRLFETPATLDAAVGAVSDLRDVAGSVPFSAFCLYELTKLPEPLPVVLDSLRRAGLELLTQAPLDRLASPERALEAVTDAGLRLSRLTINETPERSWTAVCREVAAHQRRLQSLRVFAPLARKVDETQPTTGYGDVKRIALARLLTQNVDTIQVDWELYGPKLAQVALTFGADDLDSVPAIDDESKGVRRSPLEEVRRGIRAAGFEPAERDARFNLR
jgi:CofH/MqnC-like protein